MDPRSGNPVVPPGVRLYCAVCGHLSCICDIKANHAEDCAFRRAATCAVGIPCDDHGRDCCPICDKCTCGAEVPMGRCVCCGRMTANKDPADNNFTCSRCMGEHS